MENGDSMRPSNTSMPSLLLPLLALLVTASNSRPDAMVRLAGEIGKEKILLFFQVGDQREMGKELFLTEPRNFVSSAGKLRNFSEELVVYAASDDVSFAIFSEQKLLKSLLIGYNQQCYDMRTSREGSRNLFFMEVQDCSSGLLGSGSNRLQRRSTKKIQLQIDILAVVDPSVYYHFAALDKATHSKFDKKRTLATIRTWYAHLVSSASKMYANSMSTDEQLTVRLHLTKVLVVRKKISAPWSEDTLANLNYTNVTVPIGCTEKEMKSSLNATRVLEEFRKFMLSRKIKIRYDHAVGFTRKLLASGLMVKDNRTELAVHEGIAYHSLKGYGELADRTILGLCRGFGFSVVSDRMSARTQFVLAHELGHNCGLTHDGQKTADGLTCSTDDNYLMTPVLKLLPKTERSTRLHAFRLSSCSISELKHMMLRGNGSLHPDAFCLKTRIAGTGSNDSLEAERLPGQEYSPNWQCKMWGGVNASFCVNMTTDICTVMSCRRDINSTNCIYLSSSVLDGTSCGVKMWCEQGNCVSNRNAPETCLWGDAVQDCHRIHSLKGKEYAPEKLCGQQRFRDHCCESCKAYEQPVAKRRATPESSRGAANSDEERNAKESTSPSGCPSKYKRVSNMCVCASRTAANYTTATRVCKSRQNGKVLYLVNTAELDALQEYVQQIAKRSTLVDANIWLNKKSKIQFMGSSKAPATTCSMLNAKRFTIESCPCDGANLIVCRTADNVPRS